MHQVGLFHTTLETEKLGMKDIETKQVGIKDLVNSGSERFTKNEKSLVNIIT